MFQLSGLAFRLEAMLFFLLDTPCFIFYHLSVDLWSLITASKLCDSITVLTSPEGDNPETNDLPDVARYGIFEEPIRS